MPTACLSCTTVVHAQQTNRRAREATTCFRLLRCARGAPACRFAACPSLASRERARVREHALSPAPRTWEIRVEFASEPAPSSLVTLVYLEFYV
eukprot:6196189-Pleurochrysis_carterae.AAC.1